MSNTRDWKSANKQELILEVWEALDCESVGGRELEQIQEVLQQRFGEGGQESPAAIARAVADEGAVLRHPEVLECDRVWRLRQLALHPYEQQLNFSDFDKAIASFEVLREIQQGIGDSNGLKGLRDVVSHARQDTLLLARSRILGTTERERAKEISQWLTVWIQSPQLFSDWLELRLRSPEFRNKFPDFL